MAALRTARSPVNRGITECLWPVKAGYLQARLSLPSALTKFSFLFDYKALQVQKSLAI